MARKKPEAMIALDAITHSKPMCSCGIEATSQVDGTPVCDTHYRTHYGEISRASLAEKGLERLPEETKSEHVARMRKWVKEHARLKTFADAAKAEDKWAA